MDSLIVCVTTVSSREDAERMTDILLDRSLAACVQIEGPLRSHYVWKSERCCEEEYRLVIKSSLKAWALLKSTLSEIHPYDEPQVLMWIASGSSDGYRDWVNSQTISG